VRHAKRYFERREKPELGVLKGFRANPIGYSQIAFLIILVFIYDLLYELLVPARIKKIREERWREIEREERLEEEREAKNRGADPE
jgi:hypothetical protein